jgi:hypothetical protein
MESQFELVGQLRNQIVFLLGLGERFISYSRLIQFLTPSRFLTNILYSCCCSCFFALCWEKLLESKKVSCEVGPFSLNEEVLHFQIYPSGSGNILMYSCKYIFVHVYEVVMMIHLVASHFT